MWLAAARREAGNETGATAVAQIVREDIAARLATGRDHADLRLAEAMLAAFDGEPDQVVAALSIAIELGLRNPQFAFEEPLFDNLRDNPQMIALQEKLDAILTQEHQKILQLICFNNPVPDDWQPLPKTCEGVMNRRS